MATVQAKAARTLAAAPRDNPAAMVYTAPVLGVAMMTNEVSKKVRVSMLISFYVLVI